MNALRLSVLAAAAASLLLAGCRVTENGHSHGDNVQMNTPFGSMHIKTSDDANIAGLGLSTYPGAVPIKDDDGKNHDAADVNLSFGDFHLGVKAASFHSSDDPSKIVAFYRKDMAHYGAVIECRGDKPVGEPTHTSDGLTCEQNHGGKHTYYVDASDNGTELRAGSPEHEYIVGLEPKDGGTKIGLVSLDLPSHHDASDRE